MRRVDPRVLVSVIGLILLAAACAPYGGVTPTPTPAPFYCPVTLPNGMTPPNEVSDPSYHGNGTIWTALWPEGIVVFRPSGSGVINSDGSLRMKWPWWRSIEGPVIIGAVRLDAPAPRMQTNVLRGPEDGYGTTGFHPSGLLFPTPGCWEVTAKVQDATLSFVALVVRVDNPK
jgi:hypothetical protein